MRAHDLGLQVNVNNRRLQYLATGSTLTAIGSFQLPAAQSGTEQVDNPTISADCFFGQSHFVYLHNNCRLPMCLIAMETLQLVLDPY